MLGFGVVNRDLPAVVDGIRRVTGAELDTRLDRLGGLLDALLVEQGGRCGVLAYNSFAHLEWTLGVPAHGRVVVSLNIRLAEEELAVFAADAGLEVLLTDVEHEPLARRLRHRVASLREVLVDSVAYESRLGASPTIARRAQRDGLAAISYTGGATGRPKGVMLSHANLRANAAHNAAVVGHCPDQVWLHVCPMFHVAGTANVLAATTAGAHQVILPRFDSTRVLETIAREGVTHTLLVPTMLGMLLDDPAFEASDLSSLRYLQYAASPISPDLQRRALDALSHVDVEQFYGMTEAAPSVSRLSSTDHRRGRTGEAPWVDRLKSVGRPLDGIDVEARRPDGAAAAPGEVGELHVRGPNVMVGYWNRPEETASALCDGWYRTGDVGYSDQDGYLFLVDRLKDVIVTGGENVYSVEVEHALASHSAVVEAAVFGVPDHRWGEAVHAVVVVDDPGVTDAELMAHCRNRIAGYKVPRAVEIRHEPLPRSGAGKLLKHILREPYWTSCDRRVS